MALAQATRKSPPEERVTFKLQRGVRDALLWLSVAVALYMLLALSSYNPEDPAWTHTSGGRYSNAGGPLGSYFSDIALYLLGYVAFALPGLVLYSGWLFHRNTDSNASGANEEQFHPANWALAATGLVLTLIAIAGLVTLQTRQPWWCQVPVLKGLGVCGAGGLVGELAGVKLAYLLGYVGATVFLLGLTFAAITLFTGVSWVGLAEWLGETVFRLFHIGGEEEPEEANETEENPSETLLASVPPPVVPASSDPSPEATPSRRNRGVRVEPSLGDLEETPVGSPPLSVINPKVADSSPKGESARKKVTPPIPPLSPDPDLPLLGPAVPVTPSVEPVITPAVSIEPVVDLDLLRKKSAEPATVLVPDKLPPIPLPVSATPSGLATQVLPVERPAAPDSTASPVDDSLGRSQLDQPLPESVSSPLPAPDLAKAAARVTTPRAAPTPASAVSTPEMEVLPPSLNLLDGPTAQKPAFSMEALEELSRLVEARLAEFGVDVEVVKFHPGPVITRFELQLAPGVKSNQISNLSKDLARSLSVVSVRIVEVIPGRPTVGLEIPNTQREVVGLSEVLHSPEYAQCPYTLPLALGKDIAGRPSVVDLQKMPHLLVAGTTGSGKSVAINAMILSLLYKLGPSQVRLIMVDPKMLELSIYQGIPHLLAPVVTDMKEAANALRWCVAEMEQRYRLMAALGVRNIAGFNEKVAKAIENGAPIVLPSIQASGVEPAPLTTLPYIVVVVDELADMMMTVGKKVEELIARLAQKARAAGLHLILATQRPSVDVITGLIKANIPTRISFQVSSRIDSRTILDQQGAEHLLGNGDMLYLAPGSGMPNRLHGAFVSDQEVHRVVEDLKSRGIPNYVDDILKGGSGSEGEGGNSSSANDSDDNPEDDPLYEEARRIIVETRRASVSSVQRRLKIGYNRAARLVDAMERVGIVGPIQPNGSREVLLPAPNGGD